MAETQSQASGPSEWRALTADEREDFFDAVARHNRAAWRVTLACAVAYAALGIVMSILMAPLLYCIAGLVLDVVNRFTPAPDLLGYAGKLVDGVIEPAGRPVTAGEIAWLSALAAIPGLAVFAVAARVLRRALLTSPMFHPDKIVGRPANPGTLRELRLGHTVEEMAIAASIPAPRVVFVDGSTNAAAFGTDPAHATVLVGAELVEVLSRDEMQAVAGHLVGSIADGDMQIGLRTALTLGVFSLAARLSVGWTDREAFAATGRLLRALVVPTPANLEFILWQLSDPFAQDERPRAGCARTEAMMPDAMAAAGGPAQVAAAPAPARSERLTWREWAMTPFMGPVFLSGFLGGLVNTMMLKPLVSCAWRERKYMADAVAVRLTRNPDALDGALVAIARSGASARLAAWAGHLCIVDPRTPGDGGLLGRSILGIFPSPARRHRALVRLGAAERDVAGRRMHVPWWGIALLAALGAVVVALLAVAIVMLIWVSAMISMVFTIFPTALLHALLRFAF
jgi:Zn-dependent protease with chaperone function